MIYNRLSMADIKRLGYSDQIYEILRQRIVTLELLPREKIDIGKLTREFNISATPVREALKRLVERGLVHYRKDVGYWVISLSRKDIEDIFSLRKVLECFALERGIEAISTEQLAKLEQKTRRLLLGNLSRSALRLQFDETDEDLHYNLIICCCNNAYLQMYYNQMNDHIRIARNLNERIEKAITEHLEIIEAIKARDIEKAKVALSSHLDNSALECLSMMQEFEEWPRVSEVLKLKQNKGGVCN